MPQEETLQEMTIRGGENTRSTLRRILETLGGGLVARGCFLENGV